jgi:hypothetical protein
MSKKRRDIVFVSFFTPDYAEVAAELRGDLERLNLKHDIQQIPDDESFVKIVRKKPRFMLGRLNAHPKARAVCWIDADARVRSVPHLLYQVRADSAAHWRDGVELLSGTLQFANSPKVRAFVQAWAAECESDKAQWNPCPEQQILQSMLPGSGVSHYLLPSEYCKIFDLDERNDAARKVVPVIEHFQKSRETRAVKQGCG